jgi:hypothetical protein
VIGFTVDSPKGIDLPAWAKIGFYDQETSTFFIPLQMMGDEDEVYQKILGAPKMLMIVEFEGHHYGPLSWMVEEYPEHTEQLERIRRTLISQMRTN